MVIEIRLFEPFSLYMYVFHQRRLGCHILLLPIYCDLEFLEFPNSRILTCKIKRYLDYLIYPIKTSY